MSGLPFDAASALWQRTAAGDPGQEAPVLPPVGAGPQLIPEGPGDRAAGDAMNRAVVNPLLGIWQDFKAGLPVAGTFVALFVLFVVGLLMVFSGASVAQVAAAPGEFVEGRRKRHAAERNTRYAERAAREKSEG